LQPVMATTAIARKQVNDLFIASRFLETCLVVIEESEHNTVP
jgi:hypothetical protein